MAAGLPKASTGPPRGLFRGGGREVRATAGRRFRAQSGVMLNEPGRRMVRWGRREAAGTRHWGSPLVGCGAGAALSIMPIVRGRGAASMTPVAISVFAGRYDRCMTCRVRRQPEHGAG